MVVFGLSSGSMPPFDINHLSGITGFGNKGSLFLTWATLNDYAAKREGLLWRSNDVLKWVAEGLLNIHIADTFPLAEAAEAHRLLEARKVAGKLLLLLKKICLGLQTRVICGEKNEHRSNWPW